jgi:prepilin-type N-terminal cleavage/methylation domain-containing protein
MNGPNRAQGFTILEVVVAAVIVSAVSVAVFQFMASGDRVRGRGRWIQKASALAMDEAERIKEAAWRTERITDSAYIRENDGTPIHVARRVVARPDSGLLARDSTLQEIEIAVRPGFMPADTALVTVRVVHGIMP